MTKAERIIAAYYCGDYKIPGDHCEYCPYGYGYLDDRGDSAFWWCDDEKIEDDAIDLLSVLIGSKRVNELKEMVKEQLNVSR